MSIFTLAISCLTTSNLPWFVDLTFQVPMQYFSLQHQTLLPSPIISPTGCRIFFGPSPAGRQRDSFSTARARRQGAAAISAPEKTFSTKLWAGSQLLTTSSWDPGWLTSASKVSAWGQLSKGDIQHTWEDALRRKPRWLRCTAHLGQCSHQAPYEGRCSLNITSNLTPH